MPVYYGLFYVCMFDRAIFCDQIFNKSLLMKIWRTPINKRSFFFLFSFSFFSCCSRQVYFEYKADVCILGCFLVLFEIGNIALGFVANVVTIGYVPYAETGKQK